jgi:hypothetical protein
LNPRECDLTEVVKALKLNEEIPVTLQVS